MEVVAVDKFQELERYARCGAILWAMRDTGEHNSMTENEIAAVVNDFKQDDLVYALQTAINLVKDDKLSL